VEEVAAEKPVEKTEEKSEEKCNVPENSTVIVENEFNRLTMEYNSLVSGSKQFAETLRLHLYYNFINKLFIIDKDRTILFNNLADLEAILEAGVNTDEVQEEVLAQEEQFTTWLNTINRLRDKFDF